MPVIKTSDADEWGCRLGSLVHMSSLISRQNNFATVHSVRTCLIFSLSAPERSQNAIGLTCMALVQDFFRRCQKLMKNSPPENSNLLWHIGTPNSLPWSIISPSPAVSYGQLLASCKPILQNTLHVSLAPKPTIPCPCGLTGIRRIASTSIRMKVSRISSSFQFSDCVVENCCRLGPEVAHKMAHATSWWAQTAAP